MVALLPLAVFVATFLALAARRLGRVPVPRGPTAFIGGLLMVVVGALDVRAALAAVDIGTLALLAGMMLIGSALAIGGFFERAAQAVARYASTERRLVVGTLWVSAVLSALFLNDTIALFLPPVLFVVVRHAGIPAFRTLAAAALGVNLGSLLTPVGNPQNAYLATAHAIPFSDFLIHLGPLVLFGLLVATLLLAPGAARLPVTAPPVSAAPVAPRALVPALTVAGLMLVLFLLQPLHRLPLSIIALSGGLLVLLALGLLRAARPLELIRRVDGNLLLLFVGLFLLVRGAEASGITDALSQALPLGAGRRWVEVGQVVVLTFAASNLFSNVPAVLLLDGAVTALHPGYAELLAAASTLAGNTTVLASAATLIIAERAEAHGERFPFWRFSRLGLLVTALTLLVTVPYFAWLLRAT